MDQPELHHFLFLLRSDLPQRLWILVIIGQPIRIVHCMNGDIVTIFVSTPLMKHQADDPVGGLVHMDAIIRKRDVDAGAKLQGSFMLGPLTLNEGGSLEVQDESIRGAIEVLTSVFIGP